MTWFWIALISPLLYSLINHADKYLVKNIYKNVQPITMLFFTGLMSILICVSIFVSKPNLAKLDISSILILLVAGACYMYAIIPYLFALQKEEASRIVPLFQIQPFIMFILGYLFLNETITLRQIVAGLIIILGSVLISVDTSKGFRLKKSVFVLMMLSSLLFSVEALLFKFVAKDIGFWSGILYQDLGAVIAASLLFIASKNLRNDFRTMLKMGKKVYLLTAVSESLNVLARLLFNYASLLAPLVLVTLVGGLQPVFVLIIGVIFTLFIPKFGEESLLKRHLVEKIASIGMILVGTYWLLA